MSMHNDRIEISESGRLTCTVKLKPFDSPILQDIEFKIDTGADFSTVSKQTLKDLGYTAEWIAENKKLSKGTTSVASGEKVKSYYIEMPMISIYGVRGINYPLCILLDKEEELPKPTCKDCKYTVHKKMDYRLLIGNDILSCFQMTVDRADGWLYLKRLRDLDARNKQYPDRQLNFIETE